MSVREGILRHLLMQNRRNLKPGHSVACEQPDAFNHGVLALLRKR
jgi:hypothetical protein